MTQKKKKSYMHLLWMIKLFCIVLSLILFCAFVSEIVFCMTVLNMKLHVFCFLCIRIRDCALYLCIWNVLYHWIRDYYYYFLFFYFFWYLYLKLSFVSLCLRLCSVSFTLRLCSVSQYLRLCFKYLYLRLCFQYLYLRMCSVSETVFYIVLSETVHCISVSETVFSIPVSEIVFFSVSDSPWYNHKDWLGVKHQVTYLLCIWNCVLYHCIWDCVFCLCILAFVLYLRQCSVSDARTTRGVTIKSYLCEITFYTRVCSVNICRMKVNKYLNCFESFAIFG